ncbi:MAG: TIGR00180 family glycosyltransferase [Candidatus Saganbacteria bacterium]|nr:TIGR00180 family glycosyltransferase [Candidatus Saganbacteria bacterium]
MSKDLTIVLPLKDRVEYTFRWMSYVNEISFPFKIIIADGGKDKKVEETLSNKANFPKIDYEYVRYPYDKTYSDYFAKEADALSRVKTPFVAMADNDDFFVVEGLSRSVEFMSAHPEYSSCRGDIAGFIVSDGLYGEGKGFCKLYPSRSHINDSAAERVESHFSCYDPTFYDVHRTEQLAGCFKLLSDLDLNDIFLAELLPSFLVVAYGKTKRIPGLYLLRQLAVPGSSADNENKRGDIFDRMLNELWTLDFNKVMGAIAKAISEQDKISKDIALSQVIKKFRIYVGPDIIECLSTPKSKRPNYLLGFAKRFKRKFFSAPLCIPDSISKFLGAKDSCQI